MAYHIAVGSYSDQVHFLKFDPEISSLTVLPSFTVGHHPSWLTPHRSDPSILYAGIEQSDGRVVTLKLEADGRVAILANISSGGDSPCTLLASQDEILIGNYMGGNIVIIPITDSGHQLKAHEAKTLAFSGFGPNRQRQEGSHPHQVVIHPDREELLVPDLGADLTRRLRKDDQGNWQPAGVVRYTPGGGPRHIAFFGDCMYTILELTNEITVHRLPPLPEEPTFVTSVPTMKTFPPVVGSGMTAAEILIPTPNEPFPIPLLYASNRDDPSPDGDIISIFSIAEPSKLEPVAEIRTGLKHLRGMAFGGPNDRYLIAGGANSGKAKVYERTESGKNLVELLSVDVEAPTSFLWL